jgi:hypothetical protein
MVGVNEDLGRLQSSTLAHHLYVAGRVVVRLILGAVVDVYHRLVELQLEFVKHAGPLHLT